MSTIRRARKAGSWYTGSPQVLNDELNHWLAKAGQKQFAPAKAIISPHAGYSYSGATAAHSFKEIDPAIARRIFILGPSHFVRLNDIALTSATEYETPLGNLTIDTKTIGELCETGLFSQMSLSVDENEHSIELQLPYIYKIMQACPEPYTIVPMMVGRVSDADAKKYGRLFCKYLQSPENVFVVSSDFCHWGDRFDYQHYDRSWGLIHQSIEKLDKLGMQAIKQLRAQPFCDYLKKYDNTICGRYPITVMLATLEHANAQSAKDESKPRLNIKFLHYEQSSRNTEMSDSSVSYVAASVKEFDSSVELAPVPDIADKLPVPAKCG